jgi:antirestriction protein ArdC
MCVFHEPIHSTGHERRLHGRFGDHFADEFYSKEELIAERSRLFFFAIAGIANEHTDRNTTAYIQNWIAKLEPYNRLIIHAAPNAQRAADCIIANAFEDMTETTEDTGMPSAASSPISS